MVQGAKSKTTSKTPSDFLLDQGREGYRFQSIDTYAYKVSILIKTVICCGELDPFDAFFFFFLSTQVSGKDAHNEKHLCVVCVCGHTRI